MSVTLYPASVKFNDGERYYGYVVLMEDDDEKSLSGLLTDD